MGSRTLTVAWVASVAALASTAGGGGGADRTQVTVWAAQPAASLGYGGMAYGGSDTDITGARRAITCSHDERARTVVETIEVKLENKSRRAAAIVIRELAWRWPVWKLGAEDVSSVRAGAQTLEDRVTVPVAASAS